MSPSDSSLSRTVIVGFSEPVRTKWCELHVPDGGRVFPSGDEPKIGVRHPDCEALADLAIEFDAFYCPTCGYSGRVSGAWAHDVIEDVLG